MVNRRWFSLSSALPLSVESVQRSEMASHDLAQREGVAVLATGGGDVEEQAVAGQRECSGLADLHRHVRGLLGVGERAAREVQGRTSTSGVPRRRRPSGRRPAEVIPALTSARRISSIEIGPVAQRPSSGLTAGVYWGVWAGVTGEVVVRAPPWIPTASKVRTAAQPRSVCPATTSCTVSTCAAGLLVIRQPYPSDVRETAAPRRCTRRTACCRRSGRAAHARWLSGGCP